MPAEETSLLTAAECAVAASRLEVVAAQLRAAELLAQNSGGVWVFRKPSLSQALDRAESFQRELSRSMEQIQVGQPYGPDTQKGRAPKKMAKKAVTKKKSPDKKKG